MKNLRTLMDNKAQQKTLFALLLSAGFVVSPHSYLLIRNRFR